MSMDYIMKADEQPFVSTLVNFGNFAYFAKAASEECKNMAPEEKAIENFQKETKLPESVAKEIMNVLDVSDICPLVFNREMDGGLERNRLVSQTILFDENSRRRNAQFKSIALRALRYDHIDHNSLARKSSHLLMPEDDVKDEDLEFDDEIEEIIDDDIIELPKEPENDPDIVICEPPKQLQIEVESLDKNLIISVSVYLGYTRQLQYHEIRLGRLLKVTDRLELTGDHTLLDLKNSFSCPADFAFTEDFSEKKPTIQDFARNKWPSSMFFIHDTFYIEPQSHPDWEDPSLTIRTWAQKNNYVGPMNVASMVDKKIGDLFCRLGQPYVYIHQGVCEHLIVFNDLFLRDESHENVVFPRRLVERNFRRIACDICKEASAQWMIVDHENLLPNSPAYLCSSCYKEFCFDVHGNKVCQFKAVPYCDRKDIGDGGKFISELRFESKQVD
uniref:snRNA-activating protein complex subunit 3 n=1 Tax=Caenorhabditis tropicalis TaxID=1561998 RepID=A0A1I7TF10_9PELO